MSRGGEGGRKWRERERKKEGSKGKIKLEEKRGGAQEGRAREE